MNKGLNCRYEPKVSDSAAANLDSAAPNLTLRGTEEFVPCIQGLDSECPFARICAVILEICSVHSHSAN